MENSPAFSIPNSRHEVRIVECGEPLVPISRYGRFVFPNPHPYVLLWAPYEGADPFSVRVSVLTRLQRAARLLNESHPGYRLKIYDAFRPIGVQAYMVEHVADQYCQKIAGILLREAEDDIRERAYGYAHGIWAPAVDNPFAPPPHSTWAAIDLTIVDANERELDMGSRIDEHENAHPDAFAKGGHPLADAFHKNRQILRFCMERSGFVRLPHEWWHFSFEDQNAIFEKIRKGCLSPDSVARYGRAGL